MSAGLRNSQSRWASKSLSCASVLLLAVLPTMPAAAQTAAQIDLTKYGSRAVELLQQFLRIDTSNPPGNEKPAAEFLCELFSREGIECQVFEVAPGRANAYARLRGDGSKRPIIMLTHTDVVTAEAQQWSVPPFSGEIRDGVVYGRGAQDTKGEGMAKAMAMIALKRERAPLARDIIFLAVADEEVSSLGTDWMIQHKRELLAGAEYLINEGSANVIEGGEVPLWGVDVAEKMPFWLRLTARGIAGHSSVPARDATTHRLARAVARVVNYETPLKVLPQAQRELCEQARVRFPREVERFCRLEKSLGDPAFRKRLTENSEWNYLLRNTISLTVMRGGPQTNVIPAEASAELDVRLLPGEDPQRFLAEIRGVIGDPSIEVLPILRPRPAGASPTDNELWRVFEQVIARHYPKTRLVPRLLASSTESPMYRQLGIASYGFYPFACSEAEADTAHGTDERISVEAYRRGVRVMHDVVAGIAIRP